MAEEYGTESKSETTDDYGGETEEKTGEPSPASKLAVLLAGAAPETVNVMDACTPEELEELGMETHRWVTIDERSIKKWKDRHANILKLYLGDLPPLPNGEELANAQVHWPIVATAVIRIAARIYDQQFPSNGEYFGCKPTDAADVERANRVAKHLNWQIEHKIEDYVDNHDALIIQVLLYGSGFTMVSYDPIRKCPKHEVIATEDMILPYKRKSKKANLADMPRITRVLRLYRHELEELEDAGYLKGIDKLYEDEDDRGMVRTSENDTSDPVQKVIDRDAGVTKEENDPDQPRVLWEMHRRYKFDGEKRQRPVIITVDKLTKHVLCIKIREDEDPEDRARYNREQEQIQASYDAAMAQFQMNMAQYVLNGGNPNPQPPQVHTMPDGSIMEGPPMDTTGIPAGGVTDVAAPMGAMVDPSMPVPPDPPMAPEPPRMIPINHFYHYRCLANPEGVYGNGIGTLLEGHNMFADTVGAQIVNTGTLANTPTLLMADTTRMTRGDMRIRPGEVNTVSAFGKIADAFHQLQFPPPDPKMGQLIKDQIEAGEQVSGANDILSGEVGGSNETATTTQIRMSAAVQNIAIVSKRYGRTRTAEGRAIARINSVHMTDREMFSVVDPFKQIPDQPPVIDEITVSRADYLHDYDITITADPRMASQPQRIAEASQAVGVIAQLPALQANIPLQYAVARKVFMAMDAPDLIAAMMSGAMMPSQVPPGAQPPGGPPPDEESAGGPPRPEPIPPPVPGTAQPVDQQVEVQ